MGNCNTGSHNMCGNFNQGNSINTYVNPYGQGNTIAPRYITGTQSSMNSGHVSMPGHRSNKMVRTNPVSHVMPASMNQGNGSCRTNQGNQIGHENTAAHGQGSGTNTLVNANPGNNNNPSNLLDSKPCCSKAKNSQGIPAAKEQKKDSSNSSDEEKFIPLAQPKI
ncbi:hybrid signal transduction histidine kinase M-like isoform X1 [Drosophila subpulchrella]|uniref:hybrid signal transduction histidine kinase M-like isoform X1 n=1 Tax=Drosophila subpulchrella TaxID=1486046 RepID=UPI0018A1309F|nr:hybrid signal transduction histidine kinase M-like isoform X1 [Drosophila subpulchrella]